MTASPGPTPDDTGPILRYPTRLPITASCDTAWIQTRDRSDASCTEMQCLRPPCHSGARNTRPLNPLIAAIYLKSILFVFLYLEQLLLCVEVGVGVSVAPLTVLLDDKLLPLVRCGVTV